jgi:ATP adenylyltransferase
MPYVSIAPTGDPGCIFCKALSRGDDRGALILRRREQAFLILNAFPYASGHLMAVTARHGGGLPEATAAELAEVMALVQVGMRTLSRVYRPDGFNVGVNEGRVAGAGVLDHLHVHVVPRWNGDTNFMPVLGDVRVLPEALDVTYDRLSAALDS